MFQASLSREHVKQAFRENLTRKMSEKGYTNSRLSSITGIGRSVIKTYTDDSLSLPNVFQLMRLVAALECEVSDLLPFLTNTGATDNKKLAVDVSKTLSVNTKAQEIFENLFNLEGKFLYYVPKSLPEGLKTEAVILAELGKNLDADKIKYFQSLQDLLVISFNGCILLKENVIQDLVSKRGPYKTLSMSDVFEQIQKIRQYEEDKFPNLQIKVMTEATQLISDILLIEDKVAYHEVFDRVVTIEDKEILKSAMDIMNQQIKTSRSFGGYIDEYSFNLKYHLQE
ncbi:helix-turn-helix domain-containing protein [Rhodobacterales bacterium LSUCC1028]|nr:helix-turn-helix domain-containing protein [Rhodobacterales bacterium LSUCC1028]